jgi:hypothetical protein
MAHADEEGLAVPGNASQSRLINQMQNRAICDQTGIAKYF